MQRNIFSSDFLVYVLYGTLEKSMEWTSKSLDAKNIVSLPCPTP